MAEQVSADRFKQRLAMICLRRGAPGLPRQQMDREILFKSVILTLDSTRPHAESDINSALGSWLLTVGREIEIDHVSLRRELVDAGYLVRDRDGASYQVGRPLRPAVEFEPSVEEIVPGRVILDALREAKLAKEAHRER